MSKKAKAARSEKRRKEKRQKKEAQQLKYQSFRDAGRNQKSKRAKFNIQNEKKVKCFDHPNGKCGNPACHRCFVQIWQTNSLKDLKERFNGNIPQKIWMKFQKEK